MNEKKVINKNKYYQKLYLVITLILLSFLICLIPTKASLNDGIVSYYKMDNLTSGAGEFDTFKKMNLSLIGIVPSQNGKINLSRGFYESNELFYHYNSSGLNIFNTSLSSFSVNIWSNSTALNFNHYIFAIGDQNFPPGNPFIGIWKVNTDNIYIEFGQTGGDTEVRGYHVIQINKWMMYTLTYNVTDRKISLYVNGTLNNTATYSGTYYGVPKTFYVGGSNASFYSDGFLDSVGIWNRTITASEVSNLYNSNSPSDINPITNIAPVVSNVILTSSSGTFKNNESLNCSANINDVDNNTLNVSVYWYKNYILNYTIDYNNSYSSNITFSALLDQNNLSTGDSWICGIRLFDGTDFSNIVNSSSVVITPSLLTKIFFYNETDYNINPAYAQSFYVGVNFTDKNIVVNNASCSFYASILSLKGTSRENGMINQNLSDADVGISYIKNNYALMDFIKLRFCYTNNKCNLIFSLNGLPLTIPNNEFINCEYGYEEIFSNVPAILNPSIENSILINKNSDCTDDDHYTFLQVNNYDNANLIFGRTYYDFTNSVIYNTDKGFYTNISDSILDPFIGLFNMSYYYAQLVYGQNYFNASCTYNYNGSNIITYSENIYTNIEPNINNSNILIPQADDILGSHKFIDNMTLNSGEILLYPKCNNSFPYFNIDVNIYDENNNIVYTNQNNYINLTKTNQGDSKDFIININCSYDLSNGDYISQDQNFSFHVEDSVNPIIIWFRPLSDNTSIYNPNSTVPINVSFYDVNLYNISINCIDANNIVVQNLNNYEPNSSSYLYTSNMTLTNNGSGHCDAYACDRHTDKNIFNKIKLGYGKIGEVTAMKYSYGSDNLLIADMTSTPDKYFMNYKSDRVSFYPKINQVPNKMTYRITCENYNLVFIDDKIYNPSNKLYGQYFICGMFWADFRINNTLPEDYSYTRINSNTWDVTIKFYNLKEHIALQETKKLPEKNKENIDPSSIVMDDPSIIETNSVGIRNCIMSTVYFNVAGETQGGGEDDMTIVASLNIFILLGIWMFLFVMGFIFITSEIGFIILIIDFLIGIFLSLTLIKVNVWIASLFGILQLAMLLLIYLIGRKN